MKLTKCGTKVLLLTVLLFTVLLFTVVRCQETSVAVTGNVNIANGYNYANGFGTELHWFVNVPQTLKIKKNLVYLGSVEGYLQKKKYVNSGKGFTITNKARYFVTNNIFIEGGAKNGWFYTDVYNKRATFLLAGAGYKVKEHYIYYNIGKDIHKWTDDGVNYISNRQMAHYITYDTFLPLNDKLYMLYRMNYTHGCGYNNQGTQKFCGNFFNFKAGIGFK